MALRKVGAQPSPDLVERDFVAARPNKLWVADITYNSTWTGPLYLPVAVDTRLPRPHRPGEPPSRGVVQGDALANRARPRRSGDGDPATAPSCRYAPPRSEQPIHLDRLRQALAGAGVRSSMGSVGDCYDNALCESLFASLECELLDLRPFRSQ